MREFFSGLTRKQWIYLIAGFLIVFAVILAAAGVGQEKKGPKQAATPITQEQQKTAEADRLEETSADQDGEDQSEAAAQSNTGEVVTVTRVVDGDTIEVTFPDGKVEKVRYIGINTPEAGQPYYSESTVANSSLVAGKQVRMEKDVSEIDKYGRLLRYVYVGDLMVNAELVARGYANTATYPPDVKYSEHFLALEAQARNNNLGLWAPPPSVNAEPPPVVAQPAPTGVDVTVYITKTGEKYHSDGCQYLRQSKIPISLSDAKARGYEP
ncbi:MAG: thermonuclease family protein [Actinomycetota bacterium]|nr:thermonuclease family protein [Actinomycetota bacterium]